MTNTSVDQTITRDGATTADVPQDTDELDRYLQELEEKANQAAKEAENRPKVVLEDMMGRKQPIILFPIV